MRDRLSILFSTRWFYPSIMAGAVLLYLGLAVGSAMTYRPEIDEGYFASPAVNLLTSGSMGSPVIEEAGTRLKNIGQRTYWVLPLHLLAQAGWYKLFGFSLLSMRTLSAFWGLVALLSWFFIMRTLSKDRHIALLTLLLLAIDYLFIVGASLGRMDLMSAALGFAGFAVYLNLRERNLYWAILLGQSCIVASGLTHPNGILHFVGLLFLTLYFDRRRIKWQHLGLALLPYLVGGIGWGLYLLQDPAAFVAQFTSNTTTGGRMAGFKEPWMAVARELSWRYGRAYGLGEHSVGHGGPIYLKSIILLAYVLALCGALFTPTLRKHVGYRALLIMTGIYFVMLTMLDGQKETPYLLHILPLHIAMLAVWIRWCWTKRLVPAWIMAACFVVFASLQIGGMMYRIRQNTYHTLYMPAIGWLKQNTSPESTITGTPALGFGLGFNDNLSTDVRLGYASGKRPDLIVVGDDYVSSFKEYQNKEPELYQYINRLLAEEYREVYENPAFKIYARR